MSLYPERSPLDELTEARMEARNASDVLAANRRHAEAFARMGGLTKGQMNDALRRGEQRVLEKYERLYWSQAGAAKYLLTLTEPPVARGFQWIREKMEADRLKRRV